MTLKECLASSSTAQLDQMLPFRHRKAATASINAEGDLLGCLEP